MRTIWKFPLECNSIRDDQHRIELQAPRGARPLSVGHQNGVNMLWAEVDPSLPKVTLTLLCIGTGFGSVPEGATFIGTIIDGSYVWHLYY